MLLPRRSARVVVWFILLLAPSFVRADEKALIDENWDAVFLGTDKVGYVHSTVHELKEAGRDLIQMRAESVMSIKRFGQTIDLKTDYTSVETRDGKLVRLDNRLMQSAVEQRTRGEVAGNVLRLTVETLGKQTPANIPWGDDILAAYAEEQLLKKKPLKPGEKRTYRSFSPDFNQVITNTISGEDTEEVTLLDGSKRRLQRVRAQIDGMPALKNMKLYHWVDDKGETLKAHTDFVISQTIYRTSKEVAMAKPDKATGDFGITSLIKTEKKIDRPFDASEAVYRIEIQDDDPFDLIPQDERQRLSKDDNGQVLLTIRSIDPKQPPAEPAKKPAAEFLEPNSMIQSDNAKVVSSAKEAVGDATDPWEKAQRIEKWVHDNIKEKNFSLGLASAAEVAQNREGDCTEHGVLLAAMARAAGIPARVAVGLIYADRLSAFGYHMWTEVYVNGHWVPLDGTLGLGHASPGHLKIFDSSMAGVDAVATLLPVAAVMNRLTIEVVSWKHADAK